MSKIDLPDYLEKSLEDLTKKGPIPVTRSQVAQKDEILYVPKHLEKGLEEHGEALGMLLLPGVKESSGETVFVVRLEGTLKDASSRHYEAQIYDLSSCWENHPEKTHLDEHMYRYLTCGWRKAEECGLLAMIEEAIGRSIPRVWDEDGNYKGEAKEST